MCALGVTGSTWLVALTPLEKKVTSDPEAVWPGLLVSCHELDSPVPFLLPTDSRAGEEGAIRAVDHAVIGGVVAVVVFAMLCLLIILGRYFARHKGKQGALAGRRSPAITAPASGDWTRFSSMGAFDYVVTQPYRGFPKLGEEKNRNLSSC